MIKSHGRRGWRRSLVLTLVALALVSLALLAGGCGGSDDSVAVAAADTTGPMTTEAEGAAAEETEPEQALLKFAQCMRDNGISDFPDPVANADGSFGFGQPQPGTDYDAWSRVVKGPCREQLADAGLTFGGQGGDAAAEAERQDTLLALAKCMRAEGVSWRDPDPNESAMDAIHGALGNLDRSSPTLQAALAKCQSLLSDAFGHGG